MPSSCSMPSSFRTSFYAMFVLQKLCIGKSPSSVTFFLQLHISSSAVHRDTGYLTHGREAKFAGSFF